MELDWSDILGQDTMPIAQGANFHVARDNNSSKSLVSFKRLVFVLVALFLGYAVGIRLWRRFLLWRERSYKLATRRRHGIPDDDLRPFNVAYTDAVMRAREEELRRQAKSRPPAQDSAVQASSVSQVEAVSALNLRQRPVPDTALHSTAVALPGGYTSRYTESMLPPAPRSSIDRLPNGSSVIHIQQPSVSRRPDRPSIYTERHDGQSDSEVKKRSRHMEYDEEHEAKKTRVEGEELIDGDEDAEFEEGAPRRGSKRGIQEEADEDSDGATETKKSRGKRARKVSSEKAPQGHQVDQNMDIDDEDMDDITELKPFSRGRKRDRAEAGSTFGGDDDESPFENEVDGDSKLRRRRRKRRTVAKRKSEATYLRGKKREREGEEDESDDASDETSPSRRKRGKRSSHVQRHEIERQKSDVSMDESVTSSKRVREIGEEWESNGVRYKIGPNGQRLRQSLVKKARQKFVMPKDSQHPDRDANMEVCIECWLTEDEYQQAKADHLLAWQDSPKRSDDAEKLSLDISPQSVPFPPSIPGKNLLWSASTSTTPTMSPASHSPSETQYEFPLPRRGSSYRHSIATSVGLPMAPFGSSTSTLTAVRRISSTSRALSLTGSTNPHLALSVNGTDSPGISSLSDSTNGSPRTPAPAKVFSKWEKQELEARAIMKVREANRKKEMEKEAKEREAREARERVERERAAAAAERARLEKEKHEKERQEKERLEKEKAEREKKEKDAAAAASAASAAPGGVPSITVTAPSMGPTATASMSNNFFNQPTAKSPETSAPTGQASGVPNFFAKSAEPVKPTTTGFAFGVSNSNAPAMTTTTTTTTTTAAAPATNQLPFSFSSPGAASEQKKDAFGSAAAGSTGPLSRTQSGPMFPFTNPEGSTTQPVSAFPTPTVTGATTTNGISSSSTAGATTTPKFSFNFIKPAANTTTASASTTTPSSTGTTASTSGVSAPKFSFGSTFGTPAGVKDATTSTSPFGGSAFGTGPSNGTTTSSFGTNPSNTKPAFGTTGGIFGTTSSFGKPNGPTATFGTTGGTALPFGTTSTATSSTSDSSSPVNPFSSATTNNTNKTETKTSFNFNPVSSTPTSTSGSTTNFNFGGTPSNSSTTPSTTPGLFSFKPTTTTPQSSPFSTTTPSAPMAPNFGFSMSGSQQK